MTFFPPYYLNKSIILTPKNFFHNKKKRIMPNTNLKRTLSLTAAIMVVAGSMIGSGIFRKPATMAGQLLSPELLLLVWVAAGLITFMGALSNAEVAGMIDATGGQYVYFQKMYGKFFFFSLRLVSHCSYSIRKPGGYRLCLWRVRWLLHPLPPGTRLVKRYFTLHALRRKYFSLQ